MTHILADQFRRLLDGAAEHSKYVKWLEARSEKLTALEEQPSNAEPGAPASRPSGDEGCEEMAGVWSDDWDKALAAALTSNKRLGECDAKLTTAQSRIAELEEREARLTQERDAAVREREDMKAHLELELNCPQYSEGVLTDDEIRSIAYEAIRVRRGYPAAWIPNDYQYLDAIHACKSVLAAAAQKRLPDGAVRWSESYPNGFPNNGPYLMVLFPSGIDRNQRIAGTLHCTFIPKATE